MNKKKIFILPFFVFLIIISGCSDSEVKSSSRDIFAMDTYMNIKAYGKNSGKAVNESVDEIKRLEKLFSVTDSESDIYKINHSESAEVSNDTIEIISDTLEICKSTDGSLDITIYPLVKLWGFSSGEYRIPDNNEIQNCLKNVDYENISISGNCVSVPKNCELDLGAVAKGYTSDRIAEIFRKNNIESGIINLGGNVYIYCSERTVGVKNPFSDDIIGTIKVSDKAVITSGNYERYFTGNDGRNYCHIINSETGFPVDNGLVSVTVTGKSGLYCDALSTALFVMGKEKAIEYWRKNYQNFDMIMIENSGKIYVTENISFENKSDSEIIKIEQEN